MEHQKLADEIHAKVLSKMTFAQKWDLVCQLRKSAWKLKAAGVRANHADWTEEQIQAEVKKIFLYATT